MMASVQQKSDPPAETICNMTSCAAPLSKPSRSDLTWRAPPQTAFAHLSSLQ